MLRDVIANDFNKNQSAFARFVGITKQELFKFYHNKIPLSYKRFRVFAEKSGYKLKVKNEKI